MDATGEAVVRAELQPDEVLLWWGQPNPNRIFTTSDWLLVPFSLMWAGFAVFWEATVIIGATRAGSGFLFFVFWGLIFVGLGLYFVAGRFFVKRISKLRTYYAVSDRRVFVISTAFRHNVKSASIKRLPGLELSAGRDGSGNIAFGPSSGLTGIYANTGMDFFLWGRGVRPLAFYDLDDARKVYELVDRLAA